MRKVIPINSEEEMEEVIKEQVDRRGRPPKEEIADEEEVTDEKNQEYEEVVVRRPVKKEEPKPLQQPLLIPRCVSIEEMFNIINDKLDYMVAKAREVEKS